MQSQHKATALKHPQPEGGTPLGHTASGFSLIELMVAMVLGLLLIAAVIAIFVGTQRSHNEDTRFARLQENGRFALNVIATDLSMAGFWGNVALPSSVPAPPLFCGRNIAAAVPIELVNNPTDGNAVRAQFGCITSAADVWLGVSSAVTPSTAPPPPDALLINRVKGERIVTTVDTAGSYLRTDTSGTNPLFATVAGGAAVPAGTGYYKYTPRIYYIKEDSGLPVLYRFDLSNAGTAQSAVADGVENLHIDFGIDSDLNGTPNYFTATPVGAELAQIVNARIFLLVRSPEPDPRHEDTKTYQLGSQTVTYPLVAGTPDRYYRRVFTTTVNLRNVSNATILGSTS
jgi:type IV pilus assembly protein PilW